MVRLVKGSGPLRVLMLLPPHTPSRTSYDYLLRRTTVGSSAAQASYLETTAVPSVEAVFYQDARGAEMLLKRERKV